MSQEIVMNGDRPGDRVHELGLRINILKMAYEMERERVYTEHEPFKEKFEILKRAGADAVKDHELKPREVMDVTNVLKTANKFSKFIYEGMTVPAKWKEQGDQ